MHPVVNGQLEKFVKSNQLGELEKSEAFEIFVIFCCLNGFACENIDPYDAHLKGSEFGIDGIAILLQGKLVTNIDEAEEILAHNSNPEVDFYFFQSKSGTNYKYGDISTFFNGVKYFFEDELLNESNQINELLELKNLIYNKAVNTKNPTLTCFYATTGRYEEPQKTERLRSDFVEEMREKVIFDDKNITTQMAGASQLQQWYRSATSSNKAEIQFTESVVLPANENVDQGYIGFISAENLLKLYTEIDDSKASITLKKTVFFDNIRDYNPKSKINVQIKDSIRKDGGKSFVYRNNGVTVVSRSITRTGNLFRLEEYQIVNGCQTSNILFDYFKELIHENDKIPLNIEQLAVEHLGKINVPIRIIGSKDNEFTNTIIIGTNQQNPVKPEQFWALTPYIKGLEEYFLSRTPEEVLFLERRESQFIGTSIERTRILSTSNLMKITTACLLDQPHRAPRDFKKIMEEHKNKIFVESQDVRIFHAICFLYYRLDFMWRNLKISNVPKSYRFYVLSGLIFSLTKGLDILAQSPKDIIKIASEIIDLSLDETNFTNRIHLLSLTLDGVLQNQNSSTSEEIRDAIRSNAIFKEYKDKVIDITF